MSRSSNSDPHGVRRGASLPRLLASVSVAAVALIGCSSKKGTPVLDFSESGTGACLNVPDTLGEQVSRLPKVDCGKAHTHEIYAVVKYTDSDVFPGQQKLDTFANQVCIQKFEPYVGTSNFDSTLTFTWLTPTLTSWNDHKDREILCVLQDIKGAPLTGSMKDSHR
jgi:hypothetical protein